MFKSSNKASTAASASAPVNDAACFTDTHGVIVATTNDLPGHRIVRVLGTVYGLTVRSRNWGADIGATLKSAVGGELTAFTKLLYTSRNTATERLIGECMGRGGNAIIAMRYDQSDMNVFSQVCAYGTAVVVEKV